MSDYYTPDPSLADHFKEMDRRHVNARSIEILERLLKDVNADLPEDYSSIDIDNIWRGNIHRLIQELKDDKYMTEDNNNPVNDMFVYGIKVSREIERRIRRAKFEEAIDILTEIEEIQESKLGFRSFPIEKILKEHIRKWRTK